MHRKCLTDLLTLTEGQREEGKRDVKRKGGVDRRKRGGEGGKGEKGGNKK